MKKLPFLLLPLFVYSQDVKKMWEDIIPANFEHLEMEKDYWVNWDSGIFVSISPNFLDCNQSMSKQIAGKEEITGTGNYKITENTSTKYGDNFYYYSIQYNNEADILALVTSFCRNNQLYRVVIGNPLKGKQLNQGKGDNIKLFLKLIDNK